jgi:hypothetical protein
MEPFRLSEGLTYMTPHLAPRRLVMLVGMAALGLAACNSGSAKPPATTSTTTHPPTGTGATTTTVPGEPSTTTTTSAAAGSSVRGGCGASQLGVKAGLVYAAMGSLNQVITFTNTSTATCTLYGYPGLLMLGSSGQVIPTTVRRTASVVILPETPTTVTLPPGHKASFTLGYQDQTGYGNSICPTSADLEVTPPNAYAYLVIPDKISAYGPSLGQCGTINVSPVYPGAGTQP